MKTEFPFACKRFKRSSRRRRNELTAGWFRELFGRGSCGRLSPPSRTYYFSDTYGGTGDLLKAPDPDALICTDLRSAPFRPVHREFDIFGRERVTDHILRLVLQLHDEMDRSSILSRTAKRRIRDVGTGIFVNAAPRIDRNNGEPFYLATLRHDIRVVCTPLRTLAPVARHVESLWRLPNENAVFEHDEQFRSSYAPMLLDTGYQAGLEEVDLHAVPAYKEKWHVAYVDRFGNLVTYASDALRTWRYLKEIADPRDGSIRVSIDGRNAELLLTSSLASSLPGTTVAYLNGNIDIVRKWAPGDAATSRLERSAYRLFGEPAIGTLLSARARDSHSHDETPVMRYKTVHTEMPGHFAHPPARRNSGRCELPSADFLSVEDPGAR